MDPLSIVPLNEGHAEVLSALFNADGGDYRKFFHPFPFDADSIRKILSELREDRFWGIYCGEALIGFFMLRGLDAGFSIPSYGAYIAKKYSGKGVSRLTLQFIEAWCKLNGIPKVMIKVHPENLAAKRSYEAFGVVPGGTDPKNGHLIYYRSVE